jgi:hypothetical protein
LINITGHAVDMRGRCPAYSEELLAPSGPDRVVSAITQHTYRLNCQALGAVADHTSLSFAMILDIPARTAPGIHTLLWSLDPYVAPNAAASAPVVVMETHSTA